MKNPLLLKSSIVAGALLLSSTVLAGAATILDQVNDSDSNVGYNPLLELQQDVVAGVTGLLSSIELNFGTNFSGGGDIFVNLGSGWQTDADDFLVSLTGLTGYASVDVSAANIFIETGDVFSLGIRNGNGVGVRGTTGDSYAAGSLYDGGSFFGGGEGVENPDLDLNFRTTVAPVAPVPLPAGLPLLMVSLGSMALLRRKQKA